MFENVHANPLTWPVGWKRSSLLKKSKFSTTFARARTALFAELRLMGVQDYQVVLSTNLALRLDGLPYANLANPKDPGVAVYFKYREKPMVFACDTYQKVEDNLWAIVKTVEALRGIKRWGASEMLERTFTGFAALPPPPSNEKRSWWVVLGVPKGEHPNRIKEVYRNLARAHHPDMGGDPAKMREINMAYEESQKGAT